jgi:uncharacterized LabA/DUF88 family protein
MSGPTEREVVERLGTPGLVRVLDEVLDHARLVRLANTCGIGYPGMRTRSQRKDRILSDLAEKAKADDASRKAIVRTLRKETLSAARAWAEMGPAERATWLAAEDGAKGNGGRGLRLFLLASTPDSGVPEDEVARLREKVEALPEENGTVVAPKHGATDKDTARLRKKSAELQKKIQYLEGQLQKARDTEKALKRDLVERKGELAEARMLVERLRRESKDARDTAAIAQKTGGSPGADPAIPEISSVVRKLAAEQRKLAHQIERLGEVPKGVSAEALAPVLDSVLEVHKETAALRRERKKDLQAQAERMEELLAAVRGAARAAAEAAPSREKKPSRRKGEPERVGVFIDVQNVYYGARQLKGKLDFDALLEAAVLDRRLIQATAYVVESKEIDQSGFIARLQQRAIEVRRKTLRVRSDGSMKGDWDMEMALDILDAAPRLDVVVLVSGDGDFTSLASRVKAIGPRVEVMAFPRNTAKSLLETADRFQALDRRYMIRPAAQGVEPTAAPAEVPVVAPPEPAVSVPAKS